MLKKVEFMQVLHLIFNWRMKLNYFTYYKWLIAITLLLNFKIGFAQVYKADELIGDWQDAKKQTLIRCYKLNGKYYARTIWIENIGAIGKPLPKDEQHWINMVVMKDFEYSENEWVNGTIYNPKTDRTYTAFIKLINQNTLRLTGFLWFRFFAESELFTRVNNN